MWGIFIFGLYLNTSAFSSSSGSLKGNLTWQIYCITVWWKSSILSAHIQQVVENRDKIHNIALCNTRWGKKMLANILVKRIWINQSRQDGFTRVNTTPPTTRRIHVGCAIHQARKEAAEMGLMNNLTPCFLFFFSQKFFSSLSDMPITSSEPFYLFLVLFPEKIIWENTYLKMKKKTTFFIFLRKFLKCI